MVRETHSPNTEASPAYQFPAKSSQPLQQLSPERVNSISTSATTATKYSMASELSPAPSPQSSPTRRAKANLFADYDPNRGSPTKGSFVLGAGGIPQSPSLPEITALRAHGRTNSDVQGLVKRFEHLDVRDRDAESAERIRRREAELRRAVMAREEAETDAKRMRAEVRKIERVADETAERERIVCRRLEAVMGELATAKEAHAAQTAVYEKEVRKARKEAFKTSSIVVKLQEELKATRSAFRKAQQDRDLEQQRAQQKEQERFEMAYRYIPLQEELSKLGQQLKAAQEETIALKASLKEEEVARIAAEGMIALPPSQDEFGSPRKQSPVEGSTSPLSDDKENVRSVSKKNGESRRIAEDLERERMRREHAESMVDFLQMECNFRCCGCSRASRLGHELSLSLDDALKEGMAKIREDMQSILSPPGSPAREPDEQDAMDIVAEPSNNMADTEACAIEPDHERESGPDPKSEGIQHQDDQAQEEMDRSMTFAGDSPRPAPVAAPAEPVLPAEHALPASPMATAEASEQPSPAEKTASVPLRPSTPPHAPSHHDTTPYHHHSTIRTFTTTTTIPMHFTPVSKPQLAPIENAENIPPPPALSAEERTFDRAAALAAIEYRRGRAKSLANGTATPRKQMVEGVNVGGRRDISAPALGQKSANVGAGKAGGMSGAASVGRAAGRAGRMV